MREIKFRVYTEIRNEVLGMYYFDLSETGSRNDTIMQYTGLLDKNGVEIYEGDIVKDQLGNLWEVYFNMGQFLLKNKTILNAPVSLYSEPIVEIIGNIYENPNLSTTK